MPPSSTRIRSRSPRRRTATPASSSTSSSSSSYYVFWSVLCLSLSWNIYMLHQHLVVGTNGAVKTYDIDTTTMTTTTTTTKASTDLRIDRRMQSPSPPQNKTKALLTMVDLETPELLLKTAWQGLLKQRSKKTPYRVLTNVWPRRSPLDNGVQDFSLSTHGTVGRLDRLLEEYRRWGGPISAALYISSETEIEQLTQFLQDKHHLIPHVAIHVLMEDLSFMAKQYPNNILRNLAMSQLETDYFIALDVDFVTNVGAHAQLRRLQNQVPQLTTLLKNKTLLVLPAFESENRNVTVVNATGHTIWQEQVITMSAPNNKRDLIHQYDHGIVQPFHLRHFPPGHGPTRFPLWFNNQTGPIYSTIYHKRFEPYVLAYRHGLPQYWTGFRGYFFNKYSFFLECHSAGYNFAVLRDFFVFHVGKSGGSSRIPKWKSREWAKFLAYNYGMWGNRSVQEYGGYNSIY